MQEAHGFQQEVDNFNDDNNRELFCSGYYQEETNPYGTKILRCTFPDCGKVFRFKSEVSRHITIHSPNRPYHCKSKGCNKSFKRMDALDNHVRIHTKITPFYCSVSGCGQKFTTKAGLRYHLLKHKDVRAYKCELPGCDKAFITASHLKQHQVTSVYHKKIGCNKSPQEEYREYAELCQNASQNQGEIEEKIEENCIDMSQSGHTEPINSAFEEEFHHLLNRILEENRKLEQRLELWQEHCNYVDDINEIIPAGSPARHGPDSVSNESETDSLILEFSKWCDGYSFKQTINPADPLFH